MDIAGIDYLCSEVDTASGVHKYMVKICGSSLSHAVADVVRKFSTQQIAVDFCGIQHERAVLIIKCPHVVFNQIIHLLTAGSAMKFKVWHGRAPQDRDWRRIVVDYCLIDEQPQATYLNRSDFLKWCGNYDRRAAIAAAETVSDPNTKRAD